MHNRLVGQLDKSERPQLVGWSRIRSSRTWNARCLVYAPQDRITEIEVLSSPFRMVIFIGLLTPSSK